MLTKGKQINKTKQNYGLDKGKTPDVSDIAADFSLSVKWQTPLYTPGSFRVV